jgi:hypothetical protein
MAQNTLQISKTARLYVYSTQDSQPYILPPLRQPRHMRGEKILWFFDGHGADCVTTEGGYRVRGKRIVFDSPYELRRYEAYPRCDCLGKAFRFEFPGGEELEEALAHFYWDSMLPQLAERTVMRRKKRLREGYVLSTLDIGYYGGTYPCVDHEFHIRGRMAMHSALDLAVVRRMLELQFRVIAEDPRGLGRSVCSVQPNGRREYYVTRRSRDRSVKAVMFRLTGNIEIIEEFYSYFCAVKDRDYLCSRLPLLEKSAEYIASFINADGSLDSQVYYEDQVMKDGTVAQAQAFAFRAFILLGRLERISGQGGKAEEYEKIAAGLAESYRRDIPLGYWSPTERRYVDWIDKGGKVHDHIHLLSNALPVLYGFETAERGAQLNECIAKHDEVFLKFPSFLAARIEDYTEDEIGTGGPYDLCAAGRYWCHDAKYRKHIGQAETLLAQLLQVARQAKADGWQMGERYDMNYIYYQDEKNWHGSAKYYEYPCVFADVLIHDYIGVSAGEDCDIELSPCLPVGKATLEAWGISLELSPNSATVKNIGCKELSVRLGQNKTSLPVGGQACFSRA